MTEKAALRARLRQCVPDGDGSGVCTQIQRLPQWQRARCVMAFYPMPSEPDIRPLLRAALAEGKTLLLPYTDAEMRIHPCRVASLDALTPGRYGILSPNPADETAEEPELILIPAVAYDLRGNRLGHGAGCYDRFLPERTGCRVGVCFDSRLLPEIPTQPHDLPVQILCTEKRTIRNLGGAIDV